jgi:membrane protein DedA with SNARE-associated domain
MNDIAQATMGLVQSHRDWAAPIEFVLAFCESFAFISLVVPATVILFAVGGLIEASGIEFWSVWLAAVLGAIAGDWLAYDLAMRFENKIVHMWPLSRDPAMVNRGIAFFLCWGMFSVFIGRFFGHFGQSSRSPQAFVKCRG